MNIKHKRIPIIILILLVISSFCLGQVAIDNIVLGQTISIDSQILNESREIFVYTPEGYKQSKESYPVLYILDGETNFFIATAIVNFLARNQRIPRTIVVGIPNVARNRDFTPIVDERMQNSGGADNFINFLDEELLYFVDNTYRTQDFKVLFGHSLCGMFSAYTLFTNPNLFNAYISASPYLMMSDEYVIKKAEEALLTQPNLKNQLYMSIGNEPAYYNSLDRFTSHLSVKESGISWILEKYEDEDHGSIPFRTIADGLSYIFSDWQLTNNIAMEGIVAIKAHFQNRQNKYGFTTPITEATLNIIGYQLLQADENKKAIEVFEYNVELYPKSANVYDSLGDGFDKIGKKKKALNNYINAVSIAEETNDPNLLAFRNNVERLKTSE